MKETIYFAPTGSGTMPDLRLFSGRKQGLGGDGSARVGYGKSFGSFGEIVQGRRSDGEDFLVTLPIDLWSTCELTCTQIQGPLIVECPLEKSRSVVEHVLEDLGISAGYHIGIEFTRNLPIGKGLSSSTADMLAALRALQEVFGFLLRETYISRVFKSIEPHDGLQYNSSVIYNHREGYLIRDLELIPAFNIIVVDNGGTVDTLAYNRTKRFTPDQGPLFDRLFDDVVDAFNLGDRAAIAKCATRSAEIHAASVEDAFLKACLSFATDIGALGVQATHTGTCAGYLFAANADPQELASVARWLRERFRRHVFTAQTLNLLA